MTLLEATATLIDCAKTYGEHDSAVMKAVRRMEKRLAVLQLRALKAKKRCRSYAWKSLRFLNPKCLVCEHEFTFGELVHGAEINHRGWIHNFICPQCRSLVMILEGEGNSYRYVTQAMLMAENPTDSQSH